MKGAPRIDMAFPAASADLDNDGLCDLVFTGNQVGCRVYQNPEGFQFKNVTRSDTLNQDGWITGISVADVNGLIDLYRSKSG
jgi:hypothetical protein